LKNAVPYWLSLASILAVSIGVKLVFAGNVYNPSNEQIIQAFEPAFASQGFISAGATQYSGRPALLVSKGECYLYVIPVATEGWHQSALRGNLPAGGRLFFAFDGVAYLSEQPTWAPLIQSFWDRGLRYMGVRRAFKPVVALIGTPACDSSAVVWSKLPQVPFRTTSWLQ